MAQPSLAGFIGVPFSTFLLWDVVGNVISNFYILYLPGYLVGVYWDRIPAATLSVFGFAVLVVLAAMPVVIAIDRRRRSIVRKKLADRRPLELNRNYFCV